MRRARGAALTELLLVLGILIVVMVGICAMLDRTSAVAASEWRSRVLADGGADEAERELHGIVSSFGLREASATLPGSAEPPEGLTTAERATARWVLEDGLARGVGTVDVAGRAGQHDAAWHRTAERPRRGPRRRGTGSPVTHPVPRVRYRMPLPSYDRAHRAWRLGYRPIQYVAIRDGMFWPVPVKEGP